MRLRFILILAFLLALVFGTAWYFKPTGSSSSTIETKDVSPPKAADKPTFTIITSSPPKIIGQNITPEKRAAAIEAEVNHLRELAMKDDADSLARILADLTHPEKEVREVAIESAKEFGNSNAIPALKLAAQNNDDTEEKIALLQAAEFLALPQVTFESTPVNMTPERTRAIEQKVADRTARREAESAARKRPRSPLPGSKPGSWSMTNSATAP